MSNICPSSEKCPIFIGVLKDINFTIYAYKTQYCEAGETGRNNCKRWQCKNKFGKVPERLLPNTNRNLEEIGKTENYV